MFAHKGEKLKNLKEKIKRENISVLNWSMLSYLD